MPNWDLGALVEEREWPRKPKGTRKGPEGTEQERVGDPKGPEVKARPTTSIGKALSWVLKVDYAKVILPGLVSNIKDPNRRPVKRSMWEIDTSLESGP